jgi:hypothetical protein
VNSRRNVLSGVPGVSSFFDEHAANAVLLTAWLSPGMLADRLLAIAEAIANQHCPVEERPQRIAVLEAEALRLRYAEEALVCKALAAGEVVTRSLEAPPEAVLQVRIRPNVKLAKAAPLGTAAPSSEVEPQPA